MEDIAKRPKRQSVAHDIFDDRRFTSIVESVGVPPDAIGPTQLLIYESDGRPPVRDTRPPAQRDPEQAKPVVDQDSFLHGDGLGCEDPEAEFRRGDKLQVGRVSEEVKDLFSWQRQAHSCLEDVEHHAPYCKQSLIICLYCPYN